MNIIGVAWAVLLASEVTMASTTSLTLTEQKQISKLPAYVSSVVSNENPQCQLQYECRRCLPLENQPSNHVKCGSENGPKCSVQIEVVSKEQRVKICTPKMEKICPEKPCPTCPIFCQPLNQVWCEDDFKVGMAEKMTILTNYQ